MWFKPLAKKFEWANMLFLNGFGNISASPPVKITVNF